MKLLYLLMLATLLLTYGWVLARVARHSSSLNAVLGWMIGLGYFLLAPFTLMTVNGGLELPRIYDVGQRWACVDLHNPIFLTSYLVVWLLVMLTCLAVYISFPTGVPQSRIEVAWSRFRLQRVILITMALSVTSWVATIWLVGGPTLFFASHWYLRSEDLAARLGDTYTLLTHFSLANQVLFTAAAALYTGASLQAQHTKWRFLGLVFVFFLLELAMEGNRIFLAIYLLAFLMSCWIYRRRKVVALALAFSPVLVLLFSAWSSVRHDLSKIPESVSDYADADLGNPVLTSVINVTEGMSTLLLMNVIQDFGRDFDYFYGLSYSRAMTSLIPRRFYPQKPDNFTLALAKLYLPGDTTSLGATALGEMYANFGPFSLVFCPIFTLAVVGLHRWTARRHLQHGLLPALLFVLLIWVARGTFEDNFTVFLIALLLISIFHLEKGLVACSSQRLDGLAAPCI